MKQVIQSARTGKLKLKQVPAPNAGPGQLLVATRASLISAGTERMVVEFAKKSLAGKASARPDLVAKTLRKARRDGLGATMRAVLARLDEPLPLGYSAAGAVVAVGEGLEGAFRIGERVAMAGAGIANHAEFNVVPRALGGRTEWSNVVTACAPCNLRKGNARPARGSFRPLRTPDRPTSYELQGNGRAFPPNFLHESWRDFLYWDSELDPV